MPKKQITLTLTEPQERFVFSESQHPGMVAGYGAGKSQAAVARIALLAIQYPKTPFAFVEPTFDLVRLIGFPRFSEVLDSWGVDHDTNKADATIRLENDSQIIFRSADSPERMVGFEVADAVIDEADTLRQNQADDVWIKMMGRCRFKKPDGKPNTLAAVSTPEGYGFMYRRWLKDAKLGYELIRAPTSSNPYLPSGYIENLQNTYSSAQLSAYLDGEFVNLTSGTVYTEFDRKRHHMSATIGPSDTLHIGCDFNVMKQAAVVFVQMDGLPVAVDELTGMYDTPAMIQTIHSKYPGHRVMIYPDASGAQRRSVNASQSDIALLKQAGFQVCAPKANPLVKDRVATMQYLFRTDAMMVNTDRCPEFTEALERQAYDKNGEPDKASGFDHVLDAAGYYCHYRHPLVRRTVSTASFAL